MQSQKRQNDLCLSPRQTIQDHSYPSLGPKQERWRNWSWTVLWRPTRPFRTNTPKRCPFQYRGLECKSRKSRNTWSNRQIWPWNAERSRAKTTRVLPRKCTGHNKYTLPTTQVRLYTWTSPDGQHQNQIDYILCRQRWRSSIQSTKTRPGADCGSGHELLITKSRLKLKKIGETTRPFRYDLNQIPYDYVVEVRNRFKGPDLIDGVPDELWNEVHDIVQETGIKTIPMEKKCRKAQWLSGEALQIAVKRREAKSKGAKQRYKHLNAELGMDREAWRAVTHGVPKSRTRLSDWSELIAIGRMFWTHVLNMSQNGTEKDISLIWKDKQGEQQLCVCVSLCICVCVCVCVSETGQEVGMDEQTAWWSSVTGSVSFCSELILRMSC